MLTPLSSNNCECFFIVPLSNSKVLQFVSAPLLNLSKFQGTFDLNPILICVILQSNISSFLKFVSSQFILSFFRSPNFFDLFQLFSFDFANLHRRHWASYLSYLFNCPLSYMSTLFRTLSYSNSIWGTNFTTKEFVFYFNNYIKFSVILPWVFVSAVFIFRAKRSTVIHE